MEAYGDRRLRTISSPLQFETNNKVITVESEGNYEFFLSFSYFLCGIGIEMWQSFAFSFSKRVPRNLEDLGRKSPFIVGAPKCRSEVGEYCSFHITTRGHYDGSRAHGKRAAHLYFSNSTTTSKSNFHANLRHLGPYVVNGEKMVRAHYLSDARIPSSQNSKIPTENPQSEDNVANRQNRMVGVWLSVCCGLVYGMVIVGGITRLTESGLSITEWKPILGTIPPFSEENWVSEFEKYKRFPEYQRLNSQMNLDEFKGIYYWEWGHRILGRLIGVVFAIPFAYFVVKKKLQPWIAFNLLGIFLLGAFQGVLGWYMVQSGLQVGEGEWPRVSAYRLCAHLGAAFVIYLAILWNSMNALRSRVIVPSLNLQHPKSLEFSALLFLGLCFVTAMSGAFVAGLDAGLIYNEFPFMGEGIVPEEYWNVQPWWKNFFENSAAVQFNHRVLGIATASVASVLWYYATRFALNRPAKMAINCIMAMAHIQAGLGLAALLFYVPLPIAAMHQGGSLALLTFSTWFLHALKRRPILAK